MSFPRIPGSATLVYEVDLISLEEEVVYIYMYIYLAVTHTHTPVTPLNPPSPHLCPPPLPPPLPPTPHPTPAPHPRTPGGAMDAQL